MLSTLIALTLALPSPTFPARHQLGVAPEQGEVDEAKTVFFEARQLYREGKYEEALAKFERADELHPAPDMQFNIGLCHERLENWPEMITAFELYLRTKPDAPDRDDVETRIRHAQTLMKVEALTAAAEAKPAEEPPAEPRREPRPRAQPEDTPPRSDGRGRGLIITGSVLLGAGLATMAGGGLGFGIPLQQDNEDLEDIYERGNPADVGFEDAAAIEDRAEQRAMGQWVSLGIGGGVSLIGAALLTTGLVRRGRDRDRAVSVNINGPGIRLTGRF